MEVNTGKTSMVDFPASQLWLPEGKSSFLAWEEAPSSEFCGMAHKDLWSAQRVAVGAPLSVRPKGLCSENRRAKRRFEPPRKTSSHMCFFLGGQRVRQIDVWTWFSNCLSHMFQRSMKQWSTHIVTVVVSDPFGRKKQYNIAFYQSFLKDKGVDILQGGTPQWCFLVYIPWIV